MSVLVFYSTHHCNGRESESWEGAVEWEYKPLIGVVTFTFQNESAMETVEVQNHHPNNDEGTYVQPTLEGSLFIY